MLAYVCLTSSAVKLWSAYQFVLRLQSLRIRTASHTDTFPTPPGRSPWSRAEEKEEESSTMSTVSPGQCKSVLVMRHYIMHYANYTVNRALHYWWNQRAGLDADRMSVTTFWWTMLWHFGTALGQIIIIGPLRGIYVAVELVRRWPCSQDMFSSSTWWGFLYGNILALYNNPKKVFRKSFQVRCMIV